jgi:putative ABC transport system substrate-binding protein
LNGANPGEIPFYQATKFAVVVNLKTAKGLGLTIPPTVLVRVDELSNNDFCTHTLLHLLKTG